MKTLAIRLNEGELFRERIEEISKKEGIKAGVVLSVVGGLQNVVLRMPKIESDPHEIKELNGPFELISATGTINSGDSHIHISISDNDAQCFGGHLKHGCKVKNTVELVIGILEDVEFKRLPDEETGFDELSVVSIND